MKYHLVTTDASKFRENGDKLLLLGPWCLNYKDTTILAQEKGYLYVPSPFKPAYKIKEAADYCNVVYNRLLPQMSEGLNLILGTRYTQRYWKILLKPWLLCFIEIFYDRYRRIENTLKLFPEFYTRTLPEKEFIKLAPYDTNDFFNRVTKGYYNLLLFSLVIHEICPEKSINIETAEIPVEYNMQPLPKDNRIGWKRKIFSYLTEMLNIFFKGSVVLCDMYHLSPFDRLVLKLKAKEICFVDFGLKNRPISNLNPSLDLRNKIKLTGACNDFESLVYRLIPFAIPLNLIENYREYENKKVHMNNIKGVGSAVGWRGNENFKSYAAYLSTKDAKTIEFQHGGGYGMNLSMEQEDIALDKDIFYTWGWRSPEHKNTFILPSAHLSKIYDSHIPKSDSILFIGGEKYRYPIRFNTDLQPDDMPGLFEDRINFLDSLRPEIQKKIIYKPYHFGVGWNEVGRIKKAFPAVRIAEKQSSVKWLQQVKLAVVDYPQTALLEALAINVPCIFYWNHENCLMRDTAEKYFEQLREAGILFKDAKSAAEKLNCVFNDPTSWWRQEKVQKIRRDFCDRFAYSRKDWMNIWADQLKNMPC